MSIRKVARHLCFCLFGIWTFILLFYPLLLRLFLIRLLRTPVLMSWIAFPLELVRIEINCIIKVSIYFFPSKSHIYAVTIHRFSIDWRISQSSLRFFFSRFVIFFFKFVFYLHFFLYLPLACLILVALRRPRQVID